MKKIFVFLSFFCLFLVLVGCNTTPTPTPDDGETKPTEVLPPSTPTEPTVPPVVDHEHSDNGWAYDENNHWHMCTCDEQVGLESHSFDDGVVTLEPTYDTEGVMKYSCECGYYYEEIIDVIVPPTLPTPAGEREIVVDYDNQTIYVPSERDLRIAQFADLHININYGGVLVDCSNDKMDRTYAFIDQIISETDPDLIVCSGDNIPTTGVNGLAAFVTWMESYEIPWVFMYGNHEAESNKEGYRKVDLSNYLKNADTKYLIYADDYVEKYNTSYRDERYGNFTIEVCDLDTKELVGAYFFLDSGVYDSVTLKDYQRITVGEMNWYSSELDRLQALYKGEGIMPSIVFNHIQLPEFYYGYLDAKNNTNDTKFVIYQDLSTVDWDPTSIKSILNNSPKEDNGFFDLMVQKGSTKAFFVGHSHNLWFQIEKEGILLGYGPQTGFSKGFETNFDPRKSYVYNVSQDFEVTTTSVDEKEELTSGLAAKYFDSGIGDIVVDNWAYDEVSGLYTLKVLFRQYSSRVKLFFNGEELIEGEITMTGDVVEKSSLKTSNELYINYYRSILIFSWEGSGTYVFTYNPNTKTLNIKAPDQIEKEDASGFVYSGTYINTTDSAEVTGSGKLANGFYYVTADFKKEYGRIVFKFNGITLTPDNTTFKGVYLNSTNTDWSNKMYWSPDVAGELLTATGGTYMFIYDPTTKTLSINSPETGEFSAVAVNKDTSLSVWKDTNEYIYDSTTWIGNGWRAYIVVDSEGKIAYGVVNPVSGYGTANGKSYFRHSDYADYTTNPAFSYLSEPFEGQWGMTVTYKVSVPEGGFVITAYDDAKVELIEYLLGISNANAASCNTNTNNVDNIRLTYDSATGVITITK